MFRNTNKLFIFLLTILIGNLAFWIYTYRTELTSRYDPAYWKERFEKSQWQFDPTAGCVTTDPHINPTTCVWDDSYYQSTGRFLKKLPYQQESIGDDGLYAYAGWEYVHGKDPTLLNAELPPFGKYLIGISIIIFGNQNIFALLSGVGVLIALYFLSKTFIQDKAFALLPVTIFSFAPLFYTQLRAPFLDLLYLLLLLLTFLSYIRKNYILASIFLGLMAATKASSATFLLVPTTLVAYQFLRKDFHAIKKTVVFLPISGVVFTLTYLQFFLQGNTFREFLGVQKYILTFYTGGASSEPQDIWSMLLTGRFTRTEGSEVIVSEWQFLWILLFGALIWYWIFYWFKNKRNDGSLLLAVWASLYLLFLTFANIPIFQRYLLVVLPFLYNLFIYLCLPLFSRRTKSK